MSLKENINNLQNAISSLQSKASSIYEAGYQAGKAESGGAVIDPDKIIETYAYGNVISVNDISEIPHKCVISAIGKNLFDFKTEVKPIDFVFKDGSSGDYLGHEVILSPGTYTLHAEPVGEMTQSYLYGAVVDSENKAVYDANGNRISINLVADSTIKTVTVELTQGQKICLYHGYKRSTGLTIEKANNLFSRWNVQIERGTVATPYEPYAIQDTTVTICDKNLFNINKMTLSINNGDGTLTVPKRGVVSGKLSYYAPGLKVGKTYFLSANCTHTGNFIYLRGYNQSWYFGASLTMTQEILDSTVLWYNSALDGDTTVNVISDIQIEYGNTKSTFKQYTDTTINIVAGESVEFDSVDPYAYIFTNNDVVVTLKYNKSWGTQVEYDRFWDSAQSGGTLTNYSGFFAGRAWTSDNMKPKYDIEPKDASYMFAYCGYTGDLDDIFEKRGVSFDLSKATYVTYLLYMARISSIGTLDCSGSTETSINSLLNGSNLETIRCFVPPPKAALSATTFNSSGALKNIIFGGEIKKSINFSRCTKLSAESVQSAIDHLADLTGTTTQTLTFASAIGSALTEEQKAAITAKNWTLAY